MFEGLDKVDWPALSHAYGEATDVPDMLRALASKDRHVRHQALHEAYGNIFHQGTRYTATPKAIPFLIEIIAQPDAIEVEEVLGLLSHCVAGYFSPVSGPDTGSGPIWGEAVRPMADYGETVELLAECEAAAEPAVPLCVRLLGSDDAGIRRAACLVLAGLHRFAVKYDVVAALGTRITREKDAGVRAMIAFALTHVLPMTDSPILETLALTAPDMIVRVIAAMGSLRRGTRNPHVTDALLRWLTDEELDERYTALPFGSDDLPGDIASLLPALGIPVLRAALPPLVEHLKRADDFGVVGVLSAVLAAIFGDDKAPEKRAELNLEQAQILEVLAHNQAFWAIGNALSVLMERGLPSHQLSMAEYLGIEVTRDPIQAAKISARMMKGFGEQEIIEWQKVVALAADDAEAASELAVALIAAHTDLAYACELLERAIATETLSVLELGRAWYMLGIALYRLDDNEAAAAAFAKAEDFLRGDPLAEARGNRVAALQAAGRYQEALDLVERKAPQTVADYYDLGLAQVKAGQYPQCIASISRVLAAAPSHALAHYTIACAYALSGDRERALASIGRALDADPELRDDIAADSDFASLADDERFRGLTKHE